MRLRAAEVHDDLAAAMPVEARIASADLVFEGVCTDSRAEVAGRLFVALRGDRFDAHDFVADVLARGARGVVVDTAHAGAVPPTAPAAFAVPEPLVALQRLAEASLARRRPRVVAITGSNGKTTTKDLTRAALGTLGRVHATRGNLNNHIGVPLTVLERDGDEPYLVAECGANDFGELDLLSRLLRPDVVVVTNIGHAHLERFGSLEGVARAKGELLHGLRPGGAAVLNADDARCRGLAARAPGARILDFGFATRAALRIERAVPRGAEGQDLVIAGVPVFVPRPGEGNARNAAAALAVVRAWDGDLRAAAAALAGASFTAQRSAWTRAGDLDVLDDTYNANPDSMAQALALLGARPGRRIAVLGDMLELGPDAAALHAALGARVAATGVAHFLGFGPWMAHAVRAASDAGLGTRARHFATHEDLVAELRALVRPGDAVLVKGSRGSRMEKVVAALAAEVA